MELALLISEYLKDKKRHEDDSFNISEEQIVRWDFKYVPQPTMEELEALAPVIEKKAKQEKINVEAKQYLQKTDWLIVRALDSGIPCPTEIKVARAQARASIVE